MACAWVRPSHSHAEPEGKGIPVRTVPYSLFGIVVAMLFSACSAPDETSSLATLRIAILPDEGEEILRERYTPLFEYLTQETGLPCQLTIPPTYGGLVESFGNKEIDLAYFGGFTFVKASIVHNAVPLVMRDVDTRFTSVFLIRGNSPAKTFSDLMGARFSFGSSLSTSGHLMPRHFLQAEKNIVPEQYFSAVRYSGKHDQTAYWVRDGEVDLGAANSAVIRKMLTDGRLAPGEVQILWETPPFPDYVWAVQQALSEADKEKIRQAFLKLSKDDPDHAAILDGVNAGGFLPASVRDFAELKSIITKLGMLDS